MSPKATKKPAAPAKKEAPAKGASGKKGGKAASSAKGAETAIPAQAEGAPAVDQDELEEAEDAAAAAASGGGGNAAALAAATGTGEMSASFKNFRHHPDMENFYRFIFENDLRHEALEIIDVIMVEKQNRKLAKNAKAQAH